MPDSAVRVVGGAGRLLDKTRPCAALWLLMGRCWRCRPARPNWSKGFCASKFARRTAAVIRNKWQRGPPMSVPSPVRSFETRVITRCIAIGT